jgi:hypothetical protein
MQACTSAYFYAIVLKNISADCVDFVMIFTVGGYAKFIVVHSPAVPFHNLKIKHSHDESRSAINVRHQITDGDFYFRVPFLALEWRWRLAERE